MKDHDSTRDVVVVGGGLFGSVIAARLHAHGMDVEVVDRGEKMAGSTPSASLMKPSWLNSMRREDVDAGFAVLDDLYGVSDLTFKVGPIRVDTVRWCDPRKIMTRPYTRDDVVEIWPGREHIVRLRGGRDIDTRHVVIAAGVWSNQLISGRWTGGQVSGLEGKAGAAVLLRGEQIEQPFISPWAPYKQLIAFNLGSDLWVGDGSAIKAANWTLARCNQTTERCLRAVPEQSARAAQERRLEVLQGLRPYVPKKYLNGDPCFLDKVERNIWVATGGAKNGTIAAGWAAHYLGERLS